MGAETFYTTVVGRFKSPREAFRQAQEDANDYSGHQDGYSGDIQTVNGFTLRKDAPRYNSKAFDKWVEKRIDKMDKRDCECVEIKGKYFADIKIRRGYKGCKGIKAYHFYGWGAC